MNTKAANKFNTIANALPMVGDYVEVDGHKVGYTLRNGDDYVDCGFAGCQFRLGQWNNANGMPVNLEMSGRKARWIRGELRYRVQITIVGDCEPDTVTHGWWLPVTGEYVETFRKSEDHRKAIADGVADQAHECDACGGVARNAGPDHAICVDCGCENKL